MGTLILILSPSAVGSIEPETTVTYAYAGAGVADGALTGSCGALGLKPAQERGADVAVHAAGGPLLLIFTWVNYTVLWPGTADEANIILNVRQDTQSLEVPAGELRVAWPEKGTAHVFAPGYPLNGDQPFDVGFNGTRVEWSGINERVEGPAFWYPMNGNPYMFLGGYPGWKREATLRDGTLSFDSDVVLYLRAATLTGDHGYHFQMPPHRSKVAEVADPTGTAFVRTIRYAEAFVDLRSARATLVAETWRPVCASLDLRVEGALTLHDARGAYERGPEQGAFERQALTLTGRFGLEEAPKDVDREKEPRSVVEGRGAGRIDVVGVDFQPVATNPDTPSLVARVTWASLFLAGLLAVARLALEGWAFLYTRLNGDALLDHPRRALVAEFVHSNPGCALNDVARATGLSRGVLRYHVRMLAHSGTLRLVRWNGAVVLVPRDAAGRRSFARLVVERDERLAHVEEILRETPLPQSMVVTRLAARFGVGVRTARKWLAKALKAGIVTRSGSRKREVIARAA